MARHQSNRLATPASLVPPLRCAQVVAPPTTTAKRASEGQQQSAAQPLAAQQKQQQDQLLAQKEAAARLEDTFRVRGAPAAAVAQPGHLTASRCRCLPAAQPAPPCLICATCRRLSSAQDLKLESCRLEDFEVGQVLGTGSFGRVSLARHRATGHVCAIKALSKAHIVKNQQVRCVYSCWRADWLAGWPLLLAGWHWWAGSSAVR